MKIPIYQVDAFTDHVFGGNPAAVCPLDAWPPDAVLQSIALENNLAETAYFVRTDPAAADIRWFTPALEINLCGHATLASAHVLFEHLGLPGGEITFASKSGPLRATRDTTKPASRGAAGRITLDFPAYEPAPMETPDALVRGLGRRPLETWRGRDILAVFATEAEVAAIEPDFAAIATLDCIGVIATAPGAVTAEPQRGMAAPGSTCDFVSRFFAPRAGVPEDPVTGSAHTLLVPYWARRLGKTTFHAVQVSRRRGDLFCELRDGRVLMAGTAVTFLRGEIEF